MSEFPRNETILEPKQGENGRFRQLVIGSTLVALAFLVLVVGLLLIDPFNWQVLARLSGRYDATATAVPPQTFLYGGINLLEGNMEELNSLRETFAQPMSAADLDLEETQQDIDQELAEEFGVTFRDDIAPWIGQYLGAAVIGVTLDEQYGGITQADWLLLAETRDKEAADAFMVKLADYWAGDKNVTAAQESYDNVTITVLPEADYQSGFALARSGALVLIGANVQVIQQAIDAQGGESLADTDIYATAISQLPAERLLTLYFDGQQLTELAADAAGGLTNSLVMIPMNAALTGEGMRGTAVSVTLTDDGVQIDSVSDFDYEELSELQQANLPDYAPSPALGYFPADTIVYAGAKGGALSWEDTRNLFVTQMGGDREAYEESMALFARDFGVNPDTDIFPYVSGEFALALMPGSSGLLAEQLDLPLGMVMLVGITDDTQIGGTLARVTSAITDPQRGGLGLVSQVETNGFTLFDFTSTFEEAWQFTYGSGRGYLVLGTSTAALESMRFTGGETLADSPGYQAAQGAFAQDMTPVMYMNMNGVMDTIRQSMVANSDGDAEMLAKFDDVVGVIRPLHTIAAAAKTTEDHTHQTMIFFIEK